MKRLPHRHSLALAVAILMGLSTLPAARAAVTVEVVEQGERQTVLRMRVPAPRLVPVDTPAGRFFRFAGDAVNMLRNGVDDWQKPELPVAGFPLALPLQLTGDATVTVRPEGSVRTQIAAVYPVQQPETANADRRELPPFSFDPVAYRSGGAGPGGAVDRQPVFRGDASVDNFRFTPYGYEPATGELSWHDSYLITVQHAGNGCFRLDHLAGAQAGQAFDGIDRVHERKPPAPLRYIVNPAVIERSCAPVASPNPNGARFIIVTPPSLLAEAEKLAKHRQSMGISTHLVTTTQIAGSPVVAFTATLLRNWLRNYYDDHAVKPKWLLLLGDAEHIPTHYDQPNSWNMARNASDIWYGQFAPGAGPTTVPLIGIGRIPVDTAAQAATVINKIIAYELQPPANPVLGQDFYSRLTFASYFESYGTRDDRWFIEVSEQIRSHAVGQGFSVRRIYNTEPQANPTMYRSGTPVPLALRRPGFAWDGSGQDIVDAVNQGTTLLYHRDHGNWNGWGDPEFTTSSLSQISVKKNQFPVVFSINCASGIFDNETVDLPGNILGGGYGPSPTATYFGEAFLRKPDGALAVIGDTRDSATTSNGHLAIGLFDAIFPGLAPGFGTSTPVRRLGDVMNHGRAYIAAVNAGLTPNLHPSDNGAAVPMTGLRQQLNLYNLLGDPTVKLRTSAPSLFLPPGLLQVGGVLQVSVTRQVCPECTEPEMVTASVIDPLTGRLIGRSLVDANGLARIPLNGFNGRYIVRVQSQEGNVVQASNIETDTDNDGVPDSRDNCVATANPTQRDSDGDGYGDVCDGDPNNDGLVNSLDLALVRAAFGTANPGLADLNGDGNVNALDLALIRGRFGAAPGPSAWR
jgi:hypothetical protein